MSPSAQVLDFPRPLSKDQIIEEVGKRKSAKKCLICGETEEPFAHKGICDACYKKGVVYLNKGIVVCARCGEVYLRENAGYSAHFGVLKYAIFWVTDIGPVACFIGACKKCDLEENFEKVEFAMQHEI